MTTDEDRRKARRLAANAVATASLDDGCNPEVVTLLLELSDIIRERPIGHLMDIEPSGWTLQHPLFGCGRDLFACPINEAARNDVDPNVNGRYPVDVDDDGMLVIDWEHPVGSPPEGR